MTTPPLPSSSPGPYNESMEISPLPHKVPYAVVTQIRVQSPSPNAIPDDVIYPSSIHEMQEPLSEALKQPIPFE